MLAVEDYWLASEAVANGKARSRQDGFVPEAKDDLGGMIGWLGGPCPGAVVIQMPPSPTQSSHLDESLRDQDIKTMKTCSVESPRLSDFYNNNDSACTTDCAQIS